MKTWMIFAVAMAVTPAALAAPVNTGNLDGFFWKGGKDTDGIGARGAVQLDPVFVDGLLQLGDVGGADADELRLGVGLGQELARGVGVYGKFEVVNIDAGGEDETGFGLQSGLAWSPAPALSLLAQIGLIDVKDLESSEVLYGGAWALSRPLSLLVERRESVADPITRIGVRYDFGR